jgi:hypothetical protein
MEERKKLTHRDHIPNPEEEKRVRELLRKNREQELQHAEGYNADLAWNEDFFTRLADGGRKTSGKLPLDELEKRMH